MQVTINKKARDDIDVIYEWIVSDRPQAVNRVIDRIFASIDRLGDFPHLGHAGRGQGAYEWIVPGLPYVIVYHIDEATAELTITGVFHCAQAHRRGE